MKWFLRVLIPLLCLGLLLGSASAAGALPFTDVADNVWYYEAVSYCYGRGLMNGVSDTRFAPEEGVTRAMFVTTLYRAAGSPPVSTDIPFTDVIPGSWYEAPVAWAHREGIVNGVSDTSFAPDDSLTRQQLVTLLYRYGKYQSLPMGRGANLSDFYDAGQIASYAQEAFSWAYGNGIINGTDARHLSPNGLSTRAQCATFLHRFLGGAALPFIPVETRPSYNLGTCRELSGKVPVLVLFIDDSESSWTQEEISVFWYESLLPGLEFLKQQAAGYSIPLEFEPGYYASGVGGVSLQYDGVIDDDLMDGTVSSDLLLQAARCLGYTDESQFYNGMTQYIGSDDLVILTVADKPGRSYCMTDAVDDGYTYTEYCMLYSRYSTETSLLAGTVAHEILHMFGAEDYYDPYGLYPHRLALAEQLYPTDIMLNLYYDISDSTLGAYTAYTVGWSHTLPPECQTLDWWS